MSKKIFTGLSFRYKIGNMHCISKFKTIEDFLGTSFPKNNNPMSPTNETEIFHIVWNCKLTTIDKYAKTVSELKEFFKTGNIIEYVEHVTPKCKKILPTKCIRKSTHNINEVYEAVKDVLFEKDKRDAKVEFCGDIIKGNSQRYQTFFIKGLKCSCCGIEGKYFAKEKYIKDVNYHLNLYAVDNDGNEVLMTKDHIIPKSKGGKDCLDNYQTMCEVCNIAKGNKTEETNEEYK